MVTIGVDPHTQLIVAVALDAAGQVCARWQGTNTRASWHLLAQWATEQGAEVVWGIEGSGQYGRGLAQQLVASGATVYEVNPRWTAAGRQRARQPGKNDQRDATAIAQVVRQEGARLPRVQAEDVTTVAALLTSERDDAIAAATRLRNHLHQHVRQLEPGASERLTKPETVAALTTYAVPAEASTLDQARATTIRRLATRLQGLQAEIDELAQALETEARAHWAPLTELVGVGALTAGMLAGYLGPGNRFPHDAALASYAGVAPLEASSAGHVRHRLNRYGQRHLNAVLHRIVLTQARCYAPAQAYLTRRQQEGKTWREAVRALQRYIARAVLRLWKRCLGAQNQAATASP